ncbi:MFS transporter [Burkholderia sp. 3C]
MTIVRSSTSASAATDTGTRSDIRAVYAKVTRRLVPFLFICYVFAYLDRVNIGFAALSMKDDLGFSDTVYGLGAGIFFLGYVLFEVPSNLLLEKIGARKTMMRIMVVWGLVSISFVFVRTPLQFYFARFLLGTFEAGFFPGIVLYLTYWYPPAMRGKIITMFMSAIAVSGVIGGPLSGWIMANLGQLHGLADWQWLFIIEGIPSVALGILVLFVLADRPADANWLTEGEKQIVMETVKGAKPVGERDHSFGSTLRDPRLYLLSIVYFTIAAGLYIISFWLPTMVRSFHVSDPLQIGVLTAIPYLITAICMVLVGRHSDKTRERRWHVALGMIVAAVGLVAVTLVHTSLTIALCILTVTAIGVLSAMPVFWTIPTSYLSNSGAAGGLAVINCIGLIGGFASPSLLGWIKTETGRLDFGLYVFAVALVAAAALLIVTMPRHLLREAQSD